MTSVSVRFCESTPSVKKNFFKQLFWIFSRLCMYVSMLFGVCVRVCVCVCEVLSMYGVCVCVFDTTYSSML